MKNSTRKNSRDIPTSEGSFSEPFFYSTEPFLHLSIMPPDCVTISVGVFQTERVPRTRNPLPIHTRRRTMPTRMTSTTTTVMISGIMRTRKITGKGIIEKNSSHTVAKKGRPLQLVCCKGRRPVLQPFPKKEGFTFSNLL